MKKDRFVTIIKSSNDSENIGDDIIYELGKDFIEQKFKNDYLFYSSQKMPSDLVSLKYQKESNIQVLYGTNAIVCNYKPAFLRFFGVKFGFWKSRNIKNKVVLMGVGSDGGQKISFLQAMLYKNVLSKTMIHSVRDQHTKDILQKIGFDNVVNTSCPTTWKLKPFKSKKPNKNSKIVLSFSLFHDDISFVKRIISEASKKYKKVYIWIQTRGEKEFFKNQIILEENIILIPQNLHSFRDIIKQDNTFYIGTRLHASIYNLNYNNPSVTIKIDQRADGINKAVNIPIVEYNPNLKLNDIEKHFKDVEKINTKSIDKNKKLFIEN